MRVLVTGGGGFLGSAICRQLRTLNHEVIAFQRSPALQLESAGIEVIPGDITSLEDLMTAAENCDAVIHTAGKAGVWGDPESFHRINVDGTNNVLKTCNELGIRVLVHTSSPSVVHSGGDIEGADESLPIASEFHAPYPESKALAERQVLVANGPALKTVALRPHLIWGPGDPHILPRLRSKVRRGRLVLPGPDKLIDTIFVENAAEAHVLALKELFAQERCAGKPYFVTNNQPLPQGEIIRSLLNAVGVEVEIRSIPLGLARVVAGACELTWKALRLDSEPPATRFAIDQLATAHWFDTHAATRDFSYLPRISIEDGLKRLAKQS